MSRLFVVSGPSGVGKSTVLRRLAREVPGVRFAVSHTTRPPRAGEVEGEDYHFVSDAEFDELIRADAFVEYARVHAHRYGTSRKALEGDGRSDLLIEVDVQGADALRAGLPDAVTVFIEPPAFDDLATRLSGRGRGSERDVEARLRTARFEIRRAPAYDHRITNDDLGETVRQLARLIARRR